MNWKVGLLSKYKCWRSSSKASVLSIFLSMSSSPQSRSFSHCNLRFIFMKLEVTLFVVTFPPITVLVLVLSSGLSSLVASLPTFGLVVELLAAICPHVTSSNFSVHVVTSSPIGLSSNLLPWASQPS